jgi:hypothetical protein
MGHENGPLVVIQTLDGEAFLVKKEAYLRTNQTRGSSHEKDFPLHGELELFPMGV